MEYKCSVCGKDNVKLWRRYQSFSIDLMCVDCAMKDQGVNYEFNQLGYHISEHSRKGSCEIKWMVPAIPIEDEPDAFWGYTSVPQDRIIWWEKIPLR